MDVVVVESPAKAKTINKYLGDKYTVLASYGHVRDLPAKDGSVRPDADFAMDWEMDAKSAQRVAEIARALKGADHLYLATDPDREGEAISWHILQSLVERKALKGIDVKRVVFNEVTKSAVLDAVANPRDINQELVDAYLARRALDYLVGFTLSPVLWRKLPGSRSAGRVQSVALRLICEREAEIEVFKSDEYWTVDVVFTTDKGESFTAHLTHLDGKKLEKLGLRSHDDAERARRAIEAARFAITSVEKKQVRRNPYPPFTTSTLQQEASRKLGLGAVRTMQIAQRLYEGLDLGGETVGLITYMRTDGVQLSNEAVAQIRAFIPKNYGDRYLPDSPRIYKTKAKNAQEAHEAIRPTDAARRPQDVAPYLDRDQLRLYELIWKRAVASQMESAVLDQVSVDIGSTPAGVTLRATGSTILFDGFLTLYQESRDDSEDEEGKAILPALKEKDPLKRGEITPEQHFTQPPPRYTEASLVKKLEELGIGRPSTYASIIQVLQDRNYVRLESKRFTPEDRGRLVTTFLSNFFERYVEYGFTADLEEQLDDISGGRIEWRTVLRQFWLPFIAAVDGTKDLTITQVVNALDEALGPHFFPVGEGGTDPRLCPSCKNGRLGLKLGRNGGFIGCSNYPECRFTRPLAVEDPNAEEAQPRELGKSPEGEPVWMKKGPYGLYIQLGEAVGEVKPKRASLPPGTPPADITLDQALKLLSLPREIGLHPESKEPITAGIGRFGPYIRVGKLFKSLGRDDDVLTIGLNRAVSMLAEAQAKAAPLRTIGEHPADKAEITLHKGRFGPYLAWGNIRATLPRGVDADQLDLEQAAALLAARGAPKGGKQKAKRGAKKAAPKPAQAAEAKAKPKTKPKDVKKAAAKKPAAQQPAEKKAKPAAKKPAAKKAAAKKQAGERAPKRARR
jgi:DNA topoisomerase-1